MARPRKPPHLDPRHPRRSLALSMQRLRRANGWTGKALAEAYGCSPAHISRVEHGQLTPSRMLVLFYEEVFDAKGLLMSEYEVAVTADEQERRRWQGNKPANYRAIPGDASEFIGDTVPHGTLMTPGQVFAKAWTIKNIGSVEWRDRRLERQGPITGPGLITSERFVPMPEARPGETITIVTDLKAPGYDCASIGYFTQVEPPCVPRRLQQSRVRSKSPSNAGWLSCTTRARRGPRRPSQRPPARRIAPKPFDRARARSPEVSVTSGVLTA